MTRIKCEIKCVKIVWDKRMDFIMECKSMTGRRGKLFKGNVNYLWNKLSRFSVVDEMTLEITSRFCEIRSICEEKGSILL